jgi:FG-GAP-like repeat
MSKTRRVRPTLVSVAMAVVFAIPLRGAEVRKTQDLEWTSANRHRVLLTVKPDAQRRSNCPARVAVNFQAMVRDGQIFDPHTVEVVAIDAAGRSKVFDRSLHESDGARVPHRIDRLFGSTVIELSFVIPDESCNKLAVYFDTLESGLGRRDRYHGLVGDGDLFCEGLQRREINASHFDHFVDFDGDGDLDLFKGGVEPYLYCYENTGGNRMTTRGRLASGGKPFTLPCSDANRSWVTVAFHDADRDGDLDFFPSFGDGPDAGRIVFYRNTTDKSGVLAFERVGPLRTQSGVLLAGGAQGGGWFPSITFVECWDGDNSARLDAIVGSNHGCWLYRGSEPEADGSPRFSEPEAIQAGGKKIRLVNPRYDCADIDGDGDFDLFAGTQPGPVWLFENTGTRSEPKLAVGRIIAVDGKYLIGDAHSGVNVADLDADGLNDLVVGRFWERTDLNHAREPRDFGGLYRNVGTRSAPRFERQLRSSPFTEEFQICDAGRQNCVRAVDWDRDGKLDLLSGDSDGFIWFFRNETSQLWPRFARAEKVEAGGEPLSVTSSGGHARFDICDWNDDEKLDLIVADGHGTVTLFRGSGRRTSARPMLAAGERLIAGGQPLQVGGRATALVCDWDNDGLSDLVLADDKGYYACRNIGTKKEPELSSVKRIAFGERQVNYVRPNLGAFVDWDGDGQRDFIGCHFENSIRLYRNIGSAEPGAEPEFENPEGTVILQGSSPQMISGAHAVDWNGDGDLDLITGQGHGGSGLRFYERDWLEDEIHETHPKVSHGAPELKPSN